MSRDFEERMSTYGLDSWITGNDGLDYWKNEKAPEPDYATCPACRDGAHTRCFGRRYKPKYPPLGEGCDCVEREEHQTAIKVKLKRDTAWTCAFCRSGACSDCRGGECDCSRRKDDPTHGPYLGPVKLVRDSPSGGAEAPMAFMSSAPRSKSNATAQAEDSRIQLKENNECRGQATKTPTINQNNAEPNITEENKPMADKDTRLPEVVAPASLPALPQEMSIEQVVARVNKVRELQKRVMKPDKHYGVIPGTPKPTLLKPGAELLALSFMLDPQYEHTVTQDGKHREILVRCVLYHIPTGNRVASGEGSCSTYESKYAYRKATIQCPRCHKDLRRSKTEWYCWRKQGGCGSTYPLGQFKEVGRVENPDVADQYNTVLKMANKRALIAAILNATAASEIFTQDVEDFADTDSTNGTEESDIKFAESQPHSDPEHEARDEKSSLPTGGSQASAGLSDGAEADGKPEAGVGNGAGAPASQDEQAMMSEMFSRCKAPVSKKIDAIRAVIPDFKGVGNLRKDQLDIFARALQGLGGNL